MGVALSEQPAGSEIKLDHPPTPQPCLCIPSIQVNSEFVEKTDHFCLRVSNFMVLGLRDSTKMAAGIATPSVLTLPTDTSISSVYNPPVLLPLQYQDQLSGASPSPNEGSPEPHNSTAWSSPPPLTITRSLSHISPH